MKAGSQCLGLGLSSRLKPFTGFHDYSYDYFLLPRGVALLLRTAHTASMTARVLAIFLATSALLPAQSSQQPQDQDALSEQRAESTATDQEPEGAAIVVTDQPSAAGDQRADGDVDEQIAIQRESLELTRTLVGHTKDLADYTRWLVIVGTSVGVLSGLLLLFQALNTSRAATAAKNTAEAVMLAERAYLSIAPAPFPKWQDWPSIEPTAVTIVANHGKTPTRVTEVGVVLHLNEAGALAKRPEALYGTARFDRPDIYLLPNDSFSVFSPLGRFKEDLWQRWRYGAGLRMWWVCYADYIDVFDQRRRRGAAYFIDRFDQAKFEHEPKPGYNYDRPRKKGEGRDWGQD